MSLFFVSPRFTAYFWIQWLLIVPGKLNIDTKNVSLEKVTPLKIPAILGIHVKFRWCSVSHGDFHHQVGQPSKPLLGG